MIANVSAHRRAHAFAQALEEQDLQGAADEQIDTPGQEPAEPETARLLAVAGGLGELPKPTLDPEARSIQRAQLIAAMEAAFAEGGAPSDGAKVPQQRGVRGAHRAAKSLGRLRPRSRLSRRLAAGGLSVGVAAGAFSGVAAASSDALPGDSLYGLKRGMEDIKLGMAGDDSDRGRLYLDQASSRMHEARRLMERLKSGPLEHETLSEVRRSLAGVTQDAGTGHRLLHDAYERDGSLGAIQALDSFTSSHRAGWAKLRDRLPVQLADVSHDVSSVFDAIDEEVGPLRPLLPKKADEGPRQGTPTAPDSTEHGHSAAPSRSGSPSASGKEHDSPTPSPSESSSSKEDGLLGGNTGGLLGPSEHDSPSPSDGRRESHKPAQPDVTIPPLLPDLLPDLGVDGQDK
ncbi:hypothetical protein C3486_33485 [Streptomyces sp. Ru73]|uniref:DUF5667 domain-containing protein n=1 Tax=Streptomyces sp. Ru73 TaxID=2080748 RepID=UPI000CDD7108|nr:DUF5667 domain-containing protein [Streptomyces sp. Ru73]POX36461.1 hypothetical protein C3486_33485 [Streptomyces sp. Ru73]